jgi:DegV family protein with EDD domain
MHASGLAIITDSTCDIPQEMLDQYCISVLPHVVIWGGQQYRDRIDMQPMEFYRRLPVDPAWPTTSQATAYDFAQLYLQSVEEGAREIIYISVSGAVSGAIHSAEQAAQQVSEQTGVPVRIFDSCEASMGEGWQVLAAARAREAGASSGDILQLLERVRKNIRLYVYLNTVEYLYRGGRIGHAKHLVGTALNVRPIIQLDSSSGVVENVGMQFTLRKAREMMYQRFFESMDTSKPMRIAVMHGDAEQDALEMMERVRSEYHPVELLMNITGQALGIHTGPRALALIGYWEN